MKRLQAATVITEDGRVVGVQFAATPGAQASGPLARLRAGPGQVVHAIELELPAKLVTPEDISRFHVAVGRKLRWNAKGLPTSP
jgi:hypothetical protein